jgi:hypothetical protein
MSGISAVLGCELKSASIRLGKISGYNNPTNPKRVVSV